MTRVRTTYSCADSDAGEGEYEYEYVYVCEYVCEYVYELTRTHTTYTHSLPVWRS